MRVVVQRVSSGKVTVGSETAGEINRGYVLLVGVTHDDTEEDVKYTADKIANLRLFEDDDGKMNISVKDIGGEILSISQFTLYGDSRKGRRPNFMDAGKPEHAENIYEMFNQRLESEHGLHVETGRFGEMMDVSLTNDGPVTLIVEGKPS
ncbi:D-tyrosyl-tRNA(Tyr) deacylase [Crossiella cryophila]|uniref:D-aminoacyl-tRNA deacylase n=1 Tax=Salisediminibacterium halotolerans TaxID=517425 RepID=A0A1H9VBV7_9BACI|nr:MULTISPECIES: D-aminoacyl-tRNA deacylase [Salisediminibacterium]RLJ78378.1 D-tyrosyl-tRNA(Tyr) deacylase [Actinophytocola xinjiangensis]RPE88280.1 D-tyrosyl-tRNA(Tyr) deacylase [Salisediminibacterium halotolerans]TWG37354.1 D-tyrosyl-tRNA(Tyr) deacylase [Salisediminibacterium halotolerans]SES18924.1 D-tyrosyl-tRNA(Tyr) deacylase [Salisediminibacterium haloalkalitolerans]GEL06819.1 D-aminoacyl-tRNA deacylase [Salisediminibacterium halotolerans]